MACCKQIGISKLPIVCVNVDGYYESFRLMLERGYKDKMLYLKPSDLVHFEPNAEKAIAWVEEQVASMEKSGVNVKIPSIQRRKNSGWNLFNVWNPTLQNISMFAAGIIVATVIQKRNS